MSLQRSAARLFGYAVAYVVVFVYVGVLLYFVSIPLAPIADFVKHGLPYWAHVIIFVVSVGGYIALLVYDFIKARRAKRSSETRSSQDAASR